MFRIALKITLKQNNSVFLFYEREGYRGSDKLSVDSEYFTR